MNDTISESDTPKTPTRPGFTNCLFECIQWVEHIEAENAALKTDINSTQTAWSADKAEWAEIIKRKIVEHDRMRNECNALKISLRDANNEIAHLHDTIAELADSRDKLDCDNEEFADEVAKLRARIAELEADNAHLKQELDNRTNGKWSADMVELTKLRGDKQYCKIVGSENAQLRTDLRSLLDDWWQHCDNGFLGPRDAYDGIQEIDDRLTKLEAEPKETT